MNKIFLISFLFFQCFNLFSQEIHPRVFVFTDINIDKGDPDDRQSLVHLLWYANELEIEGIVTDRWNAQGLEAAKMAIDAYAEDFSKFDFQKHGYPQPEKIRNLLAENDEDAILRLKNAALKGSDPLYVLVWGNMKNFGKAIDRYPEIANHIRVITIGTGLKYGPEDEVAGDNCKEPNWNGPGRNEVFNNPRFDNMWWLEINWTYNGMFSGNGPKEMFNKLAEFGALGNHLKEVTKNQEWAQYFRVGDTPSVLYVIDSSHNPDDPTKSSWAGKFKKPFPEKRPNYYTDDNGPVEWNYADPCQTWNNLKEMYTYNKSTLEKERPEMYEALLKKLEKVYND